MNTVILYITIAVILLIALSISVVKQGNLAVVTRFGKYKRILNPGLNFRIPLFEFVYKRISIQNKSIELEFQAITNDQANVNFKTLIIYSVANEQEETIKKAAFKFIDEKSFMQSLIRSIEGAIRAFVASKKQNEILVLRKEIVYAVKAHIDESLSDWGFHLIDLQVNDISFDEAIMRSMAQVVATNNLKYAAENEAQAQFISKIKVAEAEAQSKKLVAEAEQQVERMRGEGNALLRKNIAEGLTEAGKIMDTNQVDPSFMLYTMWLDSMKHIASHSHGNILSFDGSNEGFEKTLRQMKLMKTENK